MDACRQTWQPGSNWPLGAAGRISPNHSGKAQRGRRGLAKPHLPERDFLTTKGIHFGERAFYGQVAPVVESENGAAASSLDSCVNESVSSRPTFTAGDGRT